MVLHHEQHSNKYHTTTSHPIKLLIMKAMLKGKIDDTHVNKNEKVQGVSFKHP